MLHGVEVGRMLLFPVAGSTPISHICPFGKFSHQHKQERRRCLKGSSKLRASDKITQSPVSTAGRTFPEKSTLSAKKSNKGRFMHIPHRRAGYHPSSTGQSCWRGGGRGGLFWKCRLRECFNGVRANATLESQLPKLSVITRVFDEHLGQAEFK